MKENGASFEADLKDFTPRQKAEWDKITTRFSTREDFEKSKITIVNRININLGIGIDRAKHIFDSYLAYKWNIHKGYKEEDEQDEVDVEAEP